MFHNIVVVMLAHRLVVVVLMLTHLLEREVDLAALESLAILYRHAKIRLLPLHDVRIANAADRALRGRAAVPEL